MKDKQYYLTDLEIEIPDELTEDQVDELVAKLEEADFTTDIDDGYIYIEYLPNNNKDILLDWMNEMETICKEYNASPRGNLAQIIQTW